MRSTRSLIALLTAVALAGCSDAVAPRQDLELPPVFAVGGGAEVMARQEFIVPLSNTVFIPCANENVHFDGNMVFWLHQTTTPSGVSMLHVTIPASAEGTTVRATGETSGTVWMLERGASVQTIVRRDGATQVVNVSRNETYVSESGSTLRLHHNLHLAMGNGASPEVQTEEWTCR